MKQYLELLNLVKQEGVQKAGRNGGVVSKFGTRFRHDLRNGFPLLTTKKINPLMPLLEMFAFFRGEHDLDGFHDLNCSIWDQWGLSRDWKVSELKNNKELFTELAEKLNDGSTADQAHEKYKLIEEAYHAHHVRLREYISQIPNETLANPEASAAEMAKFYETDKEPISPTAFLTKMGVSRNKIVTLMTKGELGPIYGVQWTRWKTSDGREINQLADLVSLIERNPMSRRLVLTGWNPEVISPETSTFSPDGKAILTAADRIDSNIMEGYQALPPCHLMTIFSVEPVSPFNDKPVLHCHQIMRSSDVAVGLPFNIAGYAYFQSLLADRLDFIAGELIIDSTDAHIYANQLDLTEVQLSRTPTDLPVLTAIPKSIDITDPSTLTYEAAVELVSNLQGYNPQAFIKYPVTT